MFTVWATHHINMFPSFCNDCKRFIHERIDNVLSEKKSILDIV